MALFLPLLLAFSMTQAEGLTREAAVAEARQLVARERGLSQTALEVDLAVAAIWPDASLGCPQKDHVYAQVLSEGYRVVLRDGSARFDVRVTRGRAVLCGPRSADALAVADIRSADRIQRLAKAHLAKRLGVALETVRVEFVKPATWPDADLGCPGATTAPEPKETPGFEVRLAHGERRFTYHADHERVVLCGPQDD